MTQATEFRLMVKCPWKEGSEKLYTYFVHESLEPLAKPGATALIVDPQGNLKTLPIAEVEEIVPQLFACKPVLAIYDKAAYAEWVEACKNI